MFGLGLSSVLNEYSVTVESISYPYPDGAMTICTDIFMKSGCDRMLIIDTDIIFEPKHVQMLLAHDVPFVSGVYPKKVRELEFPILPLDESTTCADLFKESNPLLVEVAACARGFTAIKREVFETCGATWKNMPDGSSEDFELCGRMRAAGIKVLIDRRILLRHEGSAVYPL
jgi:GT2 family glycosyltransferase